MRLAASRGVSVPPLSRLSERLGSWRSDANRQRRRPLALKQRLPRTRRRTERNMSARQFLPPLPTQTATPGLCRNAVTGLMIPVSSRASGVHMDVTGYRERLIELEAGLSSHIRRDVASGREQLIDT